MDFAALLDRAADRFSACMDTKVDSMMDRLEKRIDENIDSKLGPVMNRLSVLEKISHCLTMVVLLDRAVLLALLLQPSFLEIMVWCGFRDQKHTWTDRGSSQGDHHQVATGNGS